MRGLFLPEAPSNGLARGFSLVEVVVAVGIVSFALIALIGLFGVGMRGSLRANDDTCLAVMMTRVTGDVRAQGIASLSTNYYFDNRGVEVTAADPMAYYQCAVTARAVTEVSAASTNLQIAKIAFTWPVSVSAGTRPSTNTSYATYLAR